jgi:hypothetical protein
MQSKKILIAVLVVAAGPAFAWHLPADKGTMPKEDVAAIVAGNDDPETTSYKQSIDSERSKNGYCGRQSSWFLHPKFLLRGFAVNYRQTYRSFPI